MLEKLKQIGNPKICPVVAILKDGELLVGLRNYSINEYKEISVWTIPGGRCDDGETIEQTLRREVLEEVGVSKLNITQFLGEAAGAKEGDIVYIFAGKIEQEPRLMEPEKFSEWRWENINKIPKNFINFKVLKLIKENNQNI